MPNDLEMVVMFNSDEIIVAEESKIKKQNNYVHDEDKGQSVVCEMKR